MVKVCQNRIPARRFWTTMVKHGFLRLFGQFGIIPSNYKDNNGKRMKIDSSNINQQGTISRNNKEF
jgi:hypothetical protein